MKSNSPEKHGIKSVAALFILVAWALPQNLEAATAFVQSATNDAYSSTVTAPFGANVTAGNLVAVFVGWYPNSKTLSSVRDSCGNSYTILDNPATGGSSRAAMAYAVVATTGPCSVTATASSGTTFMDIIAHEIRGVDPVTPLDNNQHKINAQVYPNQPGTAANAITSGSITTTQNGDYIFGVAFNEGLNGPTITAYMA